MEALASLPHATQHSDSFRTNQLYGRRKDPVALFVHGVLLNGYLWRHQQIVAPLDSACGQGKDQVYGAAERMFGKAFAYFPRSRTAI